jgi:O-antigen/teichoic acid export membrane protein
MLAEAGARPATRALAGSLSALALAARRPLYRNGYALILSAAASSALGLAYWALVARDYSVEAVGRNSAAISAMLFVAGLSHLDLGNVLLRFLPRAGRATARLVGFSYVANACATACVSLASLVLLRAWVPELGFLTSSPWEASWFVAATVAWSVFSLQDELLAGLRQAEWVPVKNVAFALAKIALVAAIAQALPEHGIVVSWTAPVFVAIPAIILLTYVRWIPRHVNAIGEDGFLPHWHDIGRYAFGNYIGTLFNLASMNLLPLLVVQIAGSSATAYFYLAWVIGSSLQLVTINMAISLTVEGSLNQARLATYTRSVIGLLLLLLLPVVAFLVLAAPYVLAIFGDQYAAESADLLRLLALSSVPCMITAVYLAGARVRRRVTTVATLQVVPSLLVLGGSYLLLPAAGITSVGVTWLASQSLVALAVLVLMWREARAC